MLFWSLLADPAHAFCGTYVGSAGSSLVNRTSQVVIARQGTITTLTLAADYEGDLADFALLIPVPESLDPRGVRTVDPEVIDRLDQYSTPRLVSYTCDTALSTERTVGLNCAGAPALALGCASSAGSASTFYGNYTGEISLTAAAGTVTVEAAFRLAEYDVVLLGADGADGLYAWLELNGFAVPEGGDEILQDYIDDGVHFLAAKVHMEDVSEGFSRLTPLQLRYESEAWELPIRIGTISAVDEQEVIVYALTDVTAGDVQITNFPERTIEDECMWPASKYDSFSTFYQDRLRSAMRGEPPEAGDPPPTPTTEPDPLPADELGWVTEYNWTLYKLTQDTGYHCDPCTVEVEQLYDPGELADLGFVDTTSGTQTGSYGYAYTNPYAAVSGGALLTRLRLVYDPAAVVDDLALATSGIHPVNRQIRYVEYDRQLEFLFPVCGEGFAEEPGMCGDDAPPDSGSSALPPLSALGLAAVWLVTALRRRIA